MKEFFLNLLSNTLESVGESSLITILQKLHDTDLPKYKATIFAGEALVDGLLPLVTNSKTKIDDAFIKSLGEAIQQSALNNSIELRGLKITEDTEEI